MDLAGQLFGWCSTLLTFCSYQCREHKKLLIVQTLSSISICLSYYFLNAWSGMALNLVCILRNIIIYKKDCKIFSHSFWPVVIAAVMGLVGAMSWQGPISLLVVVALMVNSVFLYFPNVQNLRKSILVTSVMVVIYNACFSVWGGVVNELIAIGSALIGLYRYRKSKQKSC